MEFNDFLSIPFSGIAGNDARTIRQADPAVSDTDLVRAFLAGDEGSFAALVGRHSSGIYSFVYRYLGNADDADEVTQEVFIRVWKHIKKFDLQRNFKTWILAIAKNASLDFIKKKKPLLFSQIEEGDGDLDAFLAPYVEGVDLPHQTLEKADAKKEMSDALQKLAPAYRMVLVLRYNEHLKFREIAEVLSQPIDTVKSKHRRGLALLKKAFDGLQAEVSGV